MTAPGLAQINNQPYNLKIGPVTLRADAGTSISYNDNINLADTKRLYDLSIAPDVNVHGLWQVTELNTLTFDLGVSYSQYLVHPADSSPQISHDSQASLKLFVGDFKITFTDSPSYQDDPSQTGQLSNIIQFRTISNDANLGVDWDIGDMTATLGYGHTNYWVLEQAYSHLDHQSDSVSPQIAFRFTRTIQAGLSVSLSSIRYDQNFENNSNQLLAGPFVAAHLSENLSANAQAGWEIASYARGGGNGDSSDIGAFEGNAGITHRINDALVQSLTVGREFIPGITSNYTERTFANYTPSWHATTLFDIAPQLWWESLHDSAAIVSQTSTRFGAGLAIGFTLTQHAGISLSYKYLMKSSNQRSSDYYQNLVTLGLNYQF